MASVAFRHDDPMGLQDKLQLTVTANVSYWQDSAVGWQLCATVARPSQGPPRIKTPHVRLRCLHRQILPVQNFARLNEVVIIHIDNRVGVVA
jgi:hypothetical protein